MKVLLALVHNNNLERLYSARKTVNFLVEELNQIQEVHLDYIEVHEQEDLSPVQVKLWRRIKKLSNMTQYLYFRKYLGSSLRKWAPYLVAYWLDNVRVPGLTSRKKVSVEKVVTKNTLPLCLPVSIMN